MGKIHSPQSNDDFIRTKGRLRIFAAERTTIVVVTSAGAYQICQIVFLSNGHITIHWPYIPSNDGLLSIGQMTPLPDGQQRVALLPNGKATNHKVKFSHPINGEAHFSQDGKIYSNIRRQSFRTIDRIGHLFILNAFNITKFQPFDNRKKDRCYLFFYFRDAPVDNVLISGDWRQKKSLVENAVPKKGSIGPISEVLDKRTDVIQLWQLLSPPIGHQLDKNVLMLSCSAIPSIKGVSEPSIYFMGGLDDHEVRPDNPTDVIHKEIMVAQYPGNLDEEIRQRIGSIDFSVPIPESN